MTTKQSQKRILVLSDDDRLAKVIAVNLQGPSMEIIRLGPGSLLRQEGRARLGQIDLIVAAMSSISSEPIVELARASLSDRIGHVPILIISDRPFLADLDHRIMHMDFPFGLDVLCSQVRKILNSQPAEMAAAPSSQAGDGAQRSTICG